MRVRANTETIASYSRWKSGGWALLVLVIAASVLARPIPTASQLLAERYGWLWPAAALTSLLMIPLTIWLAAYVLFLGGRRINKKKNRFVIYCPWPKAVPLNSIKYIEASRDAEDTGKYIPSPFPGAGSGNFSFIPRRFMVVVRPRLRIFLKDQSSVTISTGLMQPDCEDIASAMTAALHRAH